VKERPILFSGEMVRAILAGTKTQTRRLVRVDDTPITSKDVAANKRQLGIPSDARNVRFTAGVYLKCDAPAGSMTVSARVECPYGEPGDRLWVRETHALNVPGCEQQRGVSYRADHQDPKGDGPANQMTWRPSIHMPRWASRITLEVTGVRVERLQAITAEDAKAEGVTVPRCSCEACSHTSAICPADATSYVEGFRDLWCKINGPESWKANPWVWAVGFRRVES